MLVVILCKGSRSPRRMTPIEQDLDETILQITADLRSKEDRIRSTTARGIQLDNLPVDFSYVR